MDERRLLRRLSRGDCAALEEIMDAYMPYVYTIAHNILAPALPREDVEEVASDTFTTLWEKGEAVRPGKLKAWLAAVTRNAALSRLRSLHLPEPLDEETMDLSAPGPEEEAVEKELAELTRRAVNALPEPDRGIFIRHYYLYQKTGDIAAELDMPASTVRVKLLRGRDKLRTVLAEGGYSDEI